MKKKILFASSFFQEHISVYIFPENKNICDDHAAILCHALKSRQIKLLHLTVLIKYKSRFWLCVTYFSPQLLSDTYFDVSSAVI